MSHIETIIKIAELRIELSQARHILMTSENDFRDLYPFLSDMHRQLRYYRVGQKELPANLDKLNEFLEKTIGKDDLAAIKDDTLEKFRSGNFAALSFSELPESVRIDTADIKRIDLLKAMLPLCFISCILDKIKSGNIEIQPAERHQHI